MLKPKNISIKKINQNQSIDKQLTHKLKNNRNGSKALKRQNISNKPSPIQNIKKHTLEDEEQSMSQSHNNFIACINGYLNELDSGKSSNFKSETINLQRLKDKIRKQKQINRSLQKKMINFQRILWERTQKLQILESAMADIQNKQNQRILTNSRAKSRKSLRKKTHYYDININSELSSQFQEEYELEKLKKRRKTQIPLDMEKMISKTMGVKPISRVSSRYYMD